MYFKITIDVIRGRPLTRVRSHANLADSSPILVPTFLQASTLMPGGAHDALHMLRQVLLPLQSCGSTSTKTRLALQSTLTQHCAAVRDEALEPARSYIVSSETPSECCKGVRRLPAAIASTARWHSERCLWPRTLHSMHCALATVRQASAMTATRQAVREAIASAAATRAVDRVGVHVGIH